MGGFTFFNMAGRRKKDKVAKELSGAGATHAPNVLIPAEVPPMPEYFKKSESLVNVWDETVTDFDRISILATTDRATIEGFCILVDQMRRMKIAIIEFGGEVYTCDTKTGTRRYKAPEYEILKETLLRLKSYAIEYGGSPASRGKTSSLLQADLFDRGAKGKNSWSDFKERVH